VLGAPVAAADYPDANLALPESDRKKAGAFAVAVVAYLYLFGSSIVLFE
jgi:hypothetical protein